MNQQTNKRHLEGIKFWIPRLSQRRPTSQVSISVLFPEIPGFSHSNVFLIICQPWKPVPDKFSNLHKNHQKSQDSSITHHDWRCAAGYESPGAAWPQATMSPSCSDGTHWVKLWKSPRVGRCWIRIQRIFFWILTDDRFKHHTDGETPTYRKTTTWTQSGEE